MRITALALVPPPSASDLPKVTPELLASVLAKYSRSNDGLEAILAKVDLANPVPCCFFSFYHQYL
jgi:hypothetical protein